MMISPEGFCSRHYLPKTILSYKLYAALKKPEFPHIFGWLQNWQCWPAMVPQTDIQHLTMLEAEVTTPQELLFAIGDEVTIPTLDVRGVVLEISAQDIILDIKLFQRKLPIKVKRDFFGEIEKV